MAWPSWFRPRLADSLRHYTRDDFAHDLSAGLTVGVVALPLAMAFGIASGVKPEQGLVTSIIAGFLISALGGSKVQIGGPAGAFVVLLYAIVERHGVANLLIATIGAGILLVLMGALRLGNLIRFVPVSIIVGFSNGIAVIVAVQQLKDFFGLSIERMPANFLSQMATLAGAWNTIHVSTFLVGAASLVLVVLWPKSYLPNHARWRRWAARVPGTVVALVLATATVSLAGLDVATVGSRFGEIPRGLPPFAPPAFDWATVQNLFAPTVSIALLCAIESLLCARVADQMIGERHDPNQELVAQGIANAVVPFFGGIAATGTIARTVTNVRSGARSPLAGMVHAAVLFLIVLVAAPLAAGIPLATLAAILLFVAWNMGDWKAFPRLRQQSRSYRLVMLTTFVLTVVFDLTVAVQVGLLLASLLFILRISALTDIEEITLPADIARPVEGRRIAVHRIFGSLFFGSITKMETLLDPAAPLPDILILEMHQLITLDATGLDALESLLSMLEKRGGRLFVAEATRQPLMTMRRGGFVARIGEDAVFEDLEDAVNAAVAWIRRQSEPQRVGEQPSVG